LKIAVVGGGWYGCHIALSLGVLDAEVTLFEKNDQLISQASAYNQNRLHQGFHYARHHRTRIQSRDGFQRFMERYPTLSTVISRNLYVVPSKGSLLDFDTYKQIMRSSGLEFVELEPELWKSYIRESEGIIQVQERMLPVSRVRDYFTQKLNQVCRIEWREFTEKDAGDYDYVVNATWGKLKLGGTGLQETRFEPTVLFEYAVNGWPAITFVDGPLYSLYPTENKDVMTLSSVIDTPQGQYETYQGAQRKLNGLSVAHLRKCRESALDAFSRNCPGFRDQATFVDYQFSIKTKPIDLYDARETNVYRNENVFTVMSGKIDTIFHAADQIIGMIETDRR
jgi:hypothetical protein